MRMRIEPRKYDFVDPLKRSFNPRASNADNRVEIIGLRLTDAANRRG